jgi:hypothetical protein
LAALDKRTADTAAEDRSCCVEEGEEALITARTDTIAARCAPRRNSRTVVTESCNSISAEAKLTD